MNMFCGHAMHLCVSVHSQNNSDCFHIHHSLIGLSDGNTVSSSRYELRLYMYLQSRIRLSITNKVRLYVMRLFAGFLVFVFGKIVVGTGFCASAAVLGFQYHSKFMN